MKKSELFFTFLLIPIDILMIVAGFTLSYWLRLNYESVPAIYFQPFVDYFKFILVTVPFWIGVFALTGLYTQSERKTMAREFGKIAVGVTAAIALVIAWIFLSRTFFFSRLIIVLTWAMAIVTITFGRYFIRFIQRWLYKYNVGVHRVIVLGHNSSTQYIVDEIKKNTKLGYKLVKLIDRDGIEKLDTIVKNNPCDEILISDANLGQKDVARVLEYCQLNRIGFKMTPGPLLISSAHMDIQQLAGVPIMEFKRTPLDGWGRIIKRVIDIFGSIILIILSSPFMLIVALLIKLTDRGPIIFKQERVGLDKNFILFKFRSMKLEYCTGDQYGGEKAAKLRKELKQKLNEVDGPVFKIANDPRITTVGRFIRKTSLDELPQFFNVLKGDMSLIGPRPPLPEEVKEYNNWQKRRLGVKPGITGMWQVSGRSKLSFDEWVRLDAYYIEHWSLWLDFQILLKTISVIFRGRGAY